MTTNYRDTLITLAPDCLLEQANRNPRPGTVAALQLERLLAAPYSLTSDDLLFAVHVERHAVAAAQIDAERLRFEGKSKACLRASPLVKTQGWGLHHDPQSGVAAIAIDDPVYARLRDDPSVRVVAGMRSSRS